MYGRCQTCGGKANVFTVSRIGPDGRCYYPGFEYLPPVPNIAVGQYLPDTTP
jgi:hypothetical protein